MWRFGEVGGFRSQRRKGDTKEAGMQRVKLLRRTLLGEQKGKSGRWRGHKGVTRGEGEGRAGAPFPNHLDLLFQK